MKIIKPAQQPVQQQVQQQVQQAGQQHTNVVVVPPTPSAPSYKCPYPSCGAAFSDKNAYHMHITSHQQKVKRKPGTVVRVCCGH